VGKEMEKMWKEVGKAQFEESAWTSEKHLHLYFDIMAKIQTQNLLNTK
jgi:hypothetical protein